jgi:thiol:disulfide interchange protein
MTALMNAQVGLLIVAAALAAWLVIRKQRAAAKLDRKYLAGLLLMSGSAFNDRNLELYTAAMREIANLMRSRRWRRRGLKSRIDRALSMAEGNCPPDVFEAANRSAKNLISIAAHSRRRAA